MSHTPRLLRVIEQNELDKISRCVRLVDSNGVFAFAVDEKYGDRISALWNMAERLRLTTEEIEGRKIDNALYKLEELELMIERGDLLNEWMGGRVDKAEAAPRTAEESSVVDGERYCHSEYGVANCKWEPGIGCTPKCPECIPIEGEEMSHTPGVDEQVNAAIHSMTERMSVHTGVKWELQRAPYESEIDIVSDGRVIATVEAGEGKEKVAQMIAAAPDMLEALELVVGHKGFDIEYIHYRCRLAIKEARGEE